MGKKSGQFIIMTAVIILLIIIVLVASIHQTATTTQSPPPIYAAIESVNQSLESILVTSLAYYSHAEIEQLSGCGAGGGEPPQTLFDQLVDNLTYIYSEYGLLIQQTRPTYNVSWCTGQLGGGSTTVTATYRFNMTRLGLSNYKDELTYSLEAYTPSCTLNTDNLTCTITVLQSGSPDEGLNQSYFYLSQGSAWMQAHHSIDYDNGTYSVSWQLTTTPSPGYGAPVAVENQFGVYVVTFAETSG